ncbi:MAG: CoB--CoM heterodisulfide reductase iron-sulfur subunit A family protein [Methanomassiliicoccales archaeon]|nr:MAG: CoB--CoM heterodisulfide reductase iron-sulfur subunit A family protein [Methanomassiliicoccales archaeon]
MGDKVGAVLVIGGGIAGMQSALDLADSGFYVYIVDYSPSIGGAMAQLDKTFPTNDCAMCIMAPKLVETGRHQNIKLVTNANVEKVEGDAGNFKVTINKRPRYVDESKCTGCGLCTQRCPVEVKDEYNRGFKIRKAVYIKYPQAVPPIHCIDQDHCIGCGICETQCRAGAIQYSQEQEKIDLKVGSIIVSPGFEEFDLSVKRREYGYGRFPNVVSSLELERMLSATGPYGGVVLRPSDGMIAQKIAFIQCVGSRDRSIGNPYCSSVCCMFAIKEAVIAQEHTPGLNSTIFFMDMRAFGKEFDDYYIRAAKEHRVRFVSNNRISSVEEDSKTKNLKIVYIKGGELQEEEFDLVVLSVGMEKPKGAKELGEKLGIELNDFDFCSTTIFSPISTNKPGIYVCGVFQDPQDSPDSVAQASGAAARASSIITSERNTLTTVKEYPPERVVGEEEPRIGAFICHCGINIGGVVNVPSVVEYVKTLPNVAYAEENLYTCSQDTQEHIKEKIKEHNLNRVVVASCTPRTHGPLFQNTVAESGLNPYLFEMANIRDQCSWVHMDEPEKATEKAKDLVRMALAKARLNAALPKVPIDVKPSALVIGGGISGMNAALELANQGFEAHLIEKEGKLGGLVNRLHYGLKGEDIPGWLGKIVENVEASDKISVYKNTTVKDVSGYVGNFVTTLNQNGEEKNVEHGAIIVATGGVEYKPTEFLYGKNDKVLTQLEFDNIMYNNEINPQAKTVVMIQCVGCRDEVRTYCSRVCCVEAVKNALKAKEKNPNIDIFILFKDMRTYGFREIYYEEAARQGIKFIRFFDDTKPVVTDDNGLEVKIYDHFLNEDVILKPDYLVLSVATIPNPDNYDLAPLLKVPLTKDGFFLEAHMKLRPVEFATEGIFVCGLAHSPKFLNECVSQSSAAVSRAATILSKEKLFVEGTVSSVDEELCIGCRTCEFVCPYGAIYKDEEKLVAKVMEVLCKGCGICGASCPENAILIRNYTDLQLTAQAMAALKGGI